MTYVRVTVDDAGYPVARPTVRTLSYVYEESRARGVPVELVMSRSRRRSAVRARQAVMRRLRADGFSTVQIGRWLGRDHSTVVHGLRGQ